MLSPRPALGALEVMREPRVGAAGASAVVLVLLVKYAALAALRGELGESTVGLVLALLLVGCLGRWAAVVLAAYSEYARLSSASGVPTYLGWANHEGVWRGGEIYEETGKRRDLVSRLYSSRDPHEVRRLVNQAGVQLVAIGSLERKDYSAAKLRRVAEAGEVVLARDGGMLIRFGFPDGPRGP